MYKIKNREIPLQGLYRNVNKQKAGEIYRANKKFHLGTLPEELGVMIAKHEQQKMPVSDVIEAMHRIKIENVNGNSVKLFRDAGGYLFSSEIDKDAFVEAVKKYSAQKNINFDPTEVVSVLKAWNLLETDKEIISNNFIIKNNEGKLNIYQEIIQLQIPPIGYNNKQKFINVIGIAASSVVLLGGIVGLCSAVGLEGFEKIINGAQEFSNDKKWIIGIVSALGGIGGGTMYLNAFIRSWQENISDGLQNLARGIDTAISESLENLKLKH